MPAGPYGSAWAIVFISLALIAAALLVLVLFVSVRLTVDISPAVLVLFIGSLVSLVVGLIYFLVDIFASLHAMQAELQDAADIAAMASSYH